jgi:hypothetical protein
MLDRLLADAISQYKPGFRVARGAEGAVFEVGSPPDPPARHHTD